MPTDLVYLPLKADVQCWLLLQSNYPLDQEGSGLGRPKALQAAQSTAYLAC